MIAIFIFENQDCWWIKIRWMVLEIVIFADSLFSHVAEDKAVLVYYAQQWLRRSRRRKCLHSAREVVDLWFVCSCCRVASGSTALLFRCWFPAIWRYRFSIYIVSSPVRKKGTCGHRRLSHAHRDSCQILGTLWCSTLDTERFDWRCGARSTSQGWNGLRGLRLADLRHLVSEKRNGWVAYRFLRAMQEGQSLFATSWRTHRKASGGQIDVGRWQQSVYRDAVSRVTAEGSSAYGSDSARAAGWFQGSTRNPQRHVPQCSVDLPFHLQGERLPAILGIGVSRHSSLPAAAADCRADESTRQAIESTPLLLEQWLSCGAIESGDRGCASRTGLRGQGGCKLFAGLGVLQEREVARWRGSAARQFSHLRHASEEIDPLIAFCRTRTHLLSEWNFACWPGLGRQLDAPGPHRRNPSSGLGPDGEDRRVECALAGSCGCSSQGHRRELLSPTRRGRAGSRWTPYLWTQMSKRLNSPCRRYVLERSFMKKYASWYVKWYSELPQTITWESYHM